MLALKNNFLMPPLKLGYCKTQGFVNDKHLHFYKRVGKHLGAVSLEPLFMEASLRELPTQLGIDSDDKVEGLKTLIDTLHTYDTKVIAHLNHPGRMANPKIPGNIYLSATDQACPNGGKVPKMMDDDDINAVIKLFVNSAIRAEKSGFDIIEIQSGHGYLLAQFLSPKTNTRTDTYGGSFENRTRFPLQVIKRVIQAVDIPIIVRISGEEMIPGGITIDESITFSKQLVQMGVAAIHVSSGTVCETPPWYFQHMFVTKGKSWEFAAAIKKEIDIPVIFVGQINTPEDIDKIKNQYQGHYMAIGRALVADPDFIGKYLGFIKEAFRPCLACSEGCLGGVKSGKGLGCMVNPEINLAYNTTTKKPKNIAVVGGGLAGMEAALGLHKKGHSITLFEKNTLGGQFNLAWLPPKKQSLKKILDYYLSEIKRLHIPVSLSEVTADSLLAGNFDEVIIATGAQPVIPKIKGLTQYHWAEILKESKLPKEQKILIIGGGLIGTEIASTLVDANNEVLLVELQNDIAKGMELIERKMTLNKLNNKNVTIYTNHKVTEVDEITKKVVIQAMDKTTTLTDIDVIVIATGMKSRYHLANELEGKIKYHLIGDALKPAKAQDAIAAGYNIAMEV